MAQCTDVQEIEDVISRFPRGYTRLVVTTSGIVASPRIFTALASIKDIGGWVQVSLDGFEETHNRMRGNHHSYSRAVEFIKTMVSMGVVVHVATCATSESIDELEALCKQVKDWGVRIYRIGVVSERGRAITSGIGSPAELRQRIIDTRRRLKLRYGSPSFTVAGFEDELPEEQRRIGNCGAGYRQFKISPDGKIHPCPMMNWPIGSIENSSLAEFIRGNNQRLAKIQSPSEKYCGTCPNLIFCRNCIAEAMQYRRTVEQCPWSKSQEVDAVLSQQVDYIASA